MGDLSARVVGLDGWTRDLRRARSEIPRSVAQANQQAAGTVAARARGRARTARRVQAKAAPAVQARGAEVVIESTAREPFAFGAFLGARRYRQFPPWVGNTWEPGGPGGAYALNPAVRDSGHEIDDLYGGSVVRPLAQAFPD